MVIYKIFLVICELVLIKESIEWIKELVKSDIIHGTDKWYKYLQGTIEDGVKLVKGNTQKVIIVLAFIIMSIIYTIPYYRVAEMGNEVVRLLCYTILISVYIINIRNILIVCKVINKELSKITLIAYTIQLIIVSIGNIALFFGIIYL